MRFFIAHAILLCTAVNGSPIRKRDFLSDIGNFFDGLEMQVDMTIFQPIANFFTEAGAEINQYVIVPAEDFFMKGQSIIVAAEYNIDMLTADLTHAIEQDIIDEVNSVNNLAVSVAQQIKSDVTTVTNNVANEFNNVIGPGIAGVGKEIGTAFTTLGDDLAPKFAEAGAYIEAHPELIAEIVLTAALIGVTAVQPELVGADGALIADIAVEVGAETGAEVAVDIGSGAAEGIADTATESFLEAADEPIYANIPSFWSSSEPIYANVQELLDQASGDVAEDIGELQPIEESTVKDVQTEAESLNSMIARGMIKEAVPIPYPNIDTIVTGLQSAGKILVVAKRSTNTKPKPSPTAPATPPIPSASLKAVVTHHYLNRTKSAKVLASGIIKNAFAASLQNGTSKAQLTPQIGTSLTKGNIKVPYPPTANAHQTAIANQIATGKATAYNKANMTLKVQMDANIPKDPCLGLPKISCAFGNQQGKPYCLHDCATRWYNRMNIVPLHF